MNSLTQEITVLNHAINCIDGLFSLNDLHKASGGADKHKPANFLRLDTTQELISEIEEESFNCSDVSNKKTAFKSVAGRFGGSYGCKELIYSYAMWISAKFHLTVIRVFDRQVSAPTPPSELSRMDILKLALDAEEENQKLTAKIEADKPLVDFSKRHAKAEGTVSLREAAKQCGYPPQSLNKYLHSKNLIYKTQAGIWLPYSDAQKRGLFDVHSYPVVGSDGVEKFRSQCKVTAKGIQHFSNLLQKEGLV